ncbi:hypothetical protein NB069_11960 [Leclercia adecarboxylata]|uniref:hypothetical protein n=1 Tax=Leclercia adecarboxylata TaxID=83655 RepID=UPI00202AB785|nr:hypothetical protein [Leclercia adecarboxylata]URN97417.1 hypothetical protein NB069_11960 [Leclercia adecarboxylata]
MFRGLSAFPLTPLAQGEIDEKAFVALQQVCRPAQAQRRRAGLGAELPGGGFALPGL